MTVSIGAGLSTHPDVRVGAIEAAQAAAGGLDGAHADLAVVFASGHHLAAPEATLEGVDEALAPAHLLGCGAGGVLAGKREVEDGTAVAVWAAALPDGDAETFHAHVEEVDDRAALIGLPDLEPTSVALLLPDPYTFPSEIALAAVGRAHPGVPVLGGIASGRTTDGTAALFLDGEVVEKGAVGVRLDGVEVLPCVSQGAAPVGPELTVTAAEGNVITELAGRPALEKLREVIGDLAPRERELVANGLLLGIVIDGGRPSYERGDFLVRGLLGIDREQGHLAVAAAVRPGQVVRLHARDAGSADADLADALGLHRRALGGVPPAGVLAFTCNGRGRAMFGVADHDARALSQAFQEAPVAGFFAAGEIGPIGGELFVHGFTATVAVFPR
jgi:small ligand-binding sensory domain FIST